MLRGSGAPSASPWRRVWGTDSSGSTSGLSGLLSRCRGSNNGSGSHSLLTCTSERVMVLLFITTIIWIAGIISAIVSSRSSGDLLHSPHTPHSHTHDIRPKMGAPPPRPGFNYAQTTLTDTNTLDSPHHPSHTAQPHMGIRGFGLERLARIQEEVAQNLHQIFHHSPDEYADRNENDDDDDTDIDQPTSSSPTSTTTSSQSSPSSSSSSSSSHTMSNPAIVILTYNRRSLLIRTLDALMTLNELPQIKLYVSQDGDDGSLADLPDMYRSKHHVELTLLTRPRKALIGPNQGSTAFLAQHYKSVLDELFLKRKHSHVVIMEDDLLASPDFLRLFIQTAPLLDTDPTIWCVSSWNDNGFKKYVADASRLMRTDYFPGLGWMTNSAIWSELSPLFPLDQWDHFLRLDSVHRGRDCLIPEISRNKNIGQHGTNMGSNFFGKYLAPIAWYEDANSSDMPYGMRTHDGRGEVSLELLRSEHYEKEMHRIVAEATVFGDASSSDVLGRLRSLASTPARLELPPPESFLVTYEKRHYPALAGVFGLLPVPRGVHKGLSSIRLGPHLVYFADVKLCPYLPPPLRFPRNPTITPVPSREGESCTAACARYDGDSVPLSNSTDSTSSLSASSISSSSHLWRCDESHFDYLNSCLLLQSIFPCSNCIGGVSGLDVPNYVSSRKKAEMYGMCLTTEDSSRCEAKHWSAQRACPCVTVVDNGGGGG